MRVQLPDATTLNGELMRKYRELLEKYDLLVHRMEAVAASRMVVTQLSRAISVAKSQAFALLEENRVITASPAWRRLGDASQSREWRTVDQAKIFSSLEEAVRSLRNDAPSFGVQLMRISDGHRVRLRMEDVTLDPSRPPAILATAIDERGVGTAVHRARNHLTAATLQARLLRDEEGESSSAGSRAGTIAELLRLASEALDPATGK